jgi:AraC family transcriptional regulator
LELGGAGSNLNGKSTLYRAALITDLARVPFTPAMLHAAWTARIAHYHESATRMPAYAQALDAFARLAAQVCASTRVTCTHPGRGMDALHLHPCVGGRVDLGERLRVRWTEDLEQPFVLRYQRAGVDETLAVSAADLEAAFGEWLGRYFPEGRFATGASPLPRLVHMPQRRMVGVGMAMSLVQPVTGQLWRTLMPLRMAIPGRIDPDRYLLKIYPAGYFEAFDPQRAFVQWAAYAVEGDGVAPEGLAVLEIPAGLYAVWHYTGSSEDHRIFQHILGEWLPGSGLVLDDRPHVDVLGAGYRHADPLSEEDICIPVRLG